MSAGESLMPSSHTEDAKAELGIDAQFSKDADIVAVTTAPIVVGLTKEELEHYRNDPKYKFLRWALFILFWLTWVGLFAAAILLIVMSPRDVNDGPWYTSANTYEIFVPSFKDSDSDDAICGDFKGIQNELDYFKGRHIDSLLLTAVFDYVKDDYEPGNVKSYEVIGKRVGGQEQLSDLVKAATDDNIKIVVDVPLTVSPQSPYFKNSYAKNGSLDLTNVESHVVLLKCVKLLTDLGVHGVYIHGKNFRDVSGFNTLISKIREQVKNNDFAVFVGCQGDACLDLNASVIVTDPHADNTPTPASIIDAHLKYAERTVIGNTSVTLLGNSVYRPRFSIPNTSEKEHFNFASLLNALRLFIYPTAHTLYGDEYGLENSNRPENPQLGLMHWEPEDGGRFSDSKETPFFPPLLGYAPHNHSLSSHRIRDRFDGLGTLRHKLRSANLTHISSNSVVRYSHAKIYYILAFNKKPTPIELPYVSLVPANLTDQLHYASLVYEGGLDSEKIVDASEKSLSLDPYDYKIIKIEK